MNMTPQTKTVLNHLHAYEHLTSWEAQGVYRIRRLASRIHDLKLAGHNITRETLRDATGQRYTRYSLTKGKTAARSH